MLDVGRLPNESDDEHFVRETIVNLMDQVLELREDDRMLRLEVKDLKQVVAHEKEMRRYALEDMGAALKKVASVDDYTAYAGMRR